MFQFLQPILLIATTGIIIPVIVHLWNVRQGKTLKVGSISLLTQGARQSSRSLKLHDFLLLVLRCLLIALLACILAAPYWQQQLSAKKEKGWILLEKESLQESYNKNKVKIDSLLKAGYDFHYLNKGFVKDDLVKALKIQKDTVLFNPVNYWSTIKELNQVVPSELPVVLFVKNNLAGFSGERPEVSINLNLHTYLSSDTASTWIAKAFLTPSDSIHLIVGHSTPFRNYYTQHNTALNAINNDQFKVEVSGGKLTVSLKDDKATAGIDTSIVNVDTSTIKCTIFSDKFRNDANYVRAALESIRRFSNKKMHIAISNNPYNITGKYDWLFWLSGQSIPNNVTANNIFKYEGGKIENKATWVSEIDKTTSNQQPVAITKTIAAKNFDIPSQPVWTNGFGSPLLLKELKGVTSVYHFYSHFDPEWNDLPWSPEFPALIFNLLFDDNTDIAKVHDKRIIDDKQLQPFLFAKSEAVVKEKFVKKADLTFYFWIAAFVLFFVERLVSFRNKKRISNG